MADWGCVVIHSVFSYSTDEGGFRPLSLWRLLKSRLPRSCLSVHANVFSLLFTNLIILWPLLSQHRPLFTLAKLPRLAVMVEVTPLLPINVTFSDYSGGFWQQTCCFFKCPFINSAISFANKWDAVISSLITQMIESLLILGLFFCLLSWGHRSTFNLCSSGTARPQIYFCKRAKSTTVEQCHASTLLKIPLT